ncbi:peptide/nickel transport system permease protein [Bacillus thermophilus]|uniref:Peptide/nickel transport system permease protein n=1 Tax=Siminovitchia thermophila TaxID=1245522 RepID=A0ABS2R7Z6_9BACI|nr:ABC transporter permease [Siminovitchia thermophila]MBM7715777.1 peptide/nickel transport system permease protein [Siminovitchia thermophila]ONK23564.1 peptide ABC transporter permease [Bacillus sp. VT-16-64]
MKENYVFQDDSKIAHVETHFETNNNIEFVKRLFSNKSAIFGSAVIFIVVITAIFAPVIAPYPYDYIDLPNMLQSPSAQHLFGTDDLGRDIFSRVIYGTRISLVVGFGVIAISLLIGVILGAVSGYFGGRIDSIIMGMTDIAWSFPVTLLAIAIIAALGPSLTNLIIAMALVSWSKYTRLIRGEFLSLREQEFIEATRVLGMGHARIIFKHMLPNALAPIIVLTTMEFPIAIIAEASLSFLGLGAQPPTPSWGAIISGGRSYILEAPWIIFFPGFILAILVLGFNLFGDALRDALDPRLKD